MVSESNVDKLQKDQANTLIQLNDCNAQVKTLKAEKTALQNENDSVKNEFKDLSDETKMTIGDQARRLRSLQNIIKAQNNAMDKLKYSMVNAMMNYKTDELNVYIKDGSVYVSMEEKLLFKSGSDVVDPKGKEALKSLANVLNTTKDINVMIEGHTDNVPIKTKIYEDNWDLSVARATTIVRILTVDDGFDPNRITASGRGKYHPIKTNDTDEGRAGNQD